MLFPKTGSLQFRAVSMNDQVHSQDSQTNFLNTQANYRTNSPVYELKRMSEHPYRKFLDSQMECITIQTAV